MKFSPALVAILVFLAALLLAGCLQPPAKTVGLTLGADNYTIRAEVASTQAAREKGLMGRTSLPENTGMLFVFNQSAPQTFWMAGTVLPLEVVFIDAHGVIASIQEMAPCASSDWSACPTYPSGAPVHFALEVNSGFASRHQLYVGQAIPAPDTS